MVTVSLKNEVSLQKIEFAGDYQISKTVNGRPSWKSGENAIWCNPNGNWMIGYWNKLGENDGEFWLAQNKYEGLLGHCCVNCFKFYRQKLCFFLYPHLGIKSKTNAYRWHLL